MGFNISVCFTLISFNGVTISRTPVNDFLKQFQFSFTGFVSLHFVQSILFNSVLYFFKHLILMFVCLLTLVVLLIFLQHYIIL